MKLVTMIGAISLTVSTALATNSFDLGNMSADLFGNDEAFASGQFVTKIEPYTLPNLENNSSYKNLLESLQSNQNFLNQGSEVLRSTGNGNGGDVLICTPDSSLGATIHLLDFYEASYVKNMKIDLGGIELSIDEKMEIFFKRVETKSRRWAKRMRAYYKEFYNEAALVDEANLVNVDDSDHLAIPTHCTIKQIAIQKQNPIDKLDPRYVINKTLWNLLTKDHKVGLIIHELIYRELLSTGNSVLTRHLVGLSSSDKLEKMSEYDFIDLSSRHELKVGLNIGLYDLMEGYNTPYMNYGYDSLYKAEASYDGDVIVEGKAFKSIPKHNHDWPSKHSLNAFLVDKITYDQSLNLKELSIINRSEEDIYVTLKDGKEVELYSNFKVDSNGSVISSFSVDFIEVFGQEVSLCDFSLYSNKSIKSIKSTSSPLKCKIPELHVENLFSLSSIEEIVFYETGEVNYIKTSRRLSSDVYLNNEKKTYYESISLAFSKSGEIIAITEL